MESHRTVLGALFVAVGAMGLVGILCVLLVFSIGSAAIGAAAAQESDVPGVLAYLPIGFGAFIALIIAFSAVPSLIAGYGLLRQRSWGLVWGLVAGLVNLPNIPIGTGVGVYAIWVFVQDGKERPKDDPVLPGATGD